MNQLKYDGLMYTIQKLIIEFDYEKYSNLPRLCIFVSVADIIKNYSHIIYKTSAKSVGTEASRVVPERPVLHGFNGKFSSHLGKAGMVANNGLNTHVERERVVDYSKDWQDKNI